MKVYLSGPMRGIYGLNFQAFHRYAKQLREQGHEVFSPAEAKVPQDDIRACMAADLEWLCREAEAVALMPGWTQSLGVRAELATARAIGLQIIDLPGFPLTQAPESHFQSEPQSSTISPSPLQTWRGFPSQGKGNMELPGGTELSQPTNLTLLSAIISTGVLLIVMAFVILLSWLGGH